jgi:hypothetical protein
MQPIAMGKAIARAGFWKGRMQLPWVCVEPVQEWLRKFEQLRLKMPRLSQKKRENG